MLKTKIKNLLILFIYSGLFFFTNLFPSNLNYKSLIFFIIGLVLGLFLMRFDEVYLYRYYLDKQTKKINLITRSLLFIFSLLPLGLLITTSTGSELGMGMFLSIITVLLLELVNYKNKTDLFHSRFMFQLKRKLSNYEIDIFVNVFAVFVFLFILLTFFLGR